MKRAVLDEHDILVGFEDVDVLGPDDIDGGAGDLTLNEYTYNRDRKVFIPLQTHSARVMQMQPVTFEAAFCDFVRSVCLQTGMPMPLVTQTWIEWYQRTFDNSGKPRVLINGKDTH